MQGYFVEKVRRMVWGAPAWSALCPNFMHGYPRRLVPTDHGGFLPGNICLAASISNLVMRSSAPGDVAAFSSGQAIANLGLTLSELFLARRSALAYAGQARQPQRLIQNMLRFGVDFLTFAPLSRETLQQLQQAAIIVESRNHDFSPSSEELENDSSASSQALSNGEEPTPSDPNETIELDASAVVSRLSEEQRAHVQTACYSLDIVMWRHFVRATARWPGFTIKNMFPGRNTYTSWPWRRVFKRGNQLIINYSSDQDAFAHWSLY